MPVYRATRAAGWALACVLIAACNRGSTPPSRPAPAPAPSASATPANAGETARSTIVVLGDSLSAGLGLLESQAFPALLQQKLDTDGYKWEVINAGISGDTTAAGRQRLDWALNQGNVRILILALGANDGLRGLPVSEMKKNLGAMIERSREKGVSVLLAGMEAPPNFGPEYVVSFRQAYRDLAKEYKVTLLPFLLDNVAGVAVLNQEDGIHPNVEGTAIVADTVWNVLRPMVDAASSSSSGGLRPPDSLTRSLARRFDGSLRSRGSLRCARSLLVPARSAFIRETLSPGPPVHALSLAASTARSVCVAHSLRSFLYRGAAPRRTPLHARSRGPRTPRAARVAHSLRSFAAAS